MADGYVPRIMPGVGRRGAAETVKKAARILVVDDDDDVLAFIDAVLTSEGYAAESATGGAEAIAALSRGSFELVITDLRMPGTDGLAVLEAVRMAGLSTRVLVISAVGSIHEAVAAMKLGAYGFLEKPIKAESLLREVAAALGAGAFEPTLASPAADWESQVRRRAGALPVADRPNAAGADASIRARGLAGGRYELGRLIGSGGMGSVYEAFDPMLGRSVAIKFLHQEPGRPDWDRVRRRFMREGWVTGSLAHPNIVAVHDFGEDASGRLFLVMELVDGASLAEHMKTQGRLSFARAANIASQAAGALAYAHRKGIVHRDVKPANILLAEGDLVKLVDFGIARVPVSDLTEAGAWVGSAGYVAPEMVRGSPIDFRADQFSLGTVVFEMVAGVPLFSDDTPYEVSKKVLEQPIPKLAELGLAPPAELQAILDRLQSREPDQRFADEHELVERLEKLAAKLRTPQQATLPRAL